MNARALAPLLALAVLAACTSTPLPPWPDPTPPAAGPGTTALPAGALPTYRCDQDIAFTVQFADGTAVIDAGPRGRETLLRDAGGLTPQQTVYSSTHLRAEFGLGPDGRGARLLYASPPMEARCLRNG
jgi:hypothetical protein